MQEIVAFNLENDMDLILTHKRAMKLAELTGLSLSIQTIFATAVSEIARAAIEHGPTAHFVLGIEAGRRNRKQLKACISDAKRFCQEHSESVTYAKRLVDNVHYASSAKETSVELCYDIPFPGLLSEAKLRSFQEYFDNELPLSPYDELRRKNVQLQEMAARLRESENNYRQLTDTLPLMMLSVAANGKIVYVNKWLKDFLGFEPTQLQAALCQPFIHPDDYAQLRAQWVKSKDGITPFHGQARLKQVDSGNFIWHLVSIIPLKKDNGTADLWMGFIVDFHAQKLIEQTLLDNTQLKETQQRLEEYQVKLEEKILDLNRSNDALEQFAYVASHDLQEPLRKIRTFTELIRKDPRNAEFVDRYLEKIYAAAGRMSILIRGVLDYSRLSEDELSYEPVALDEVLDHVLSDFELLIAEKQALVERGKLPVLKGLPLQLHQLFANLLSNALKFSRERPVIRVSSRALSKAEVLERPALDPNLNYVEIHFQDNGIGFSQAYAEKIFVLFQQLNNRMTYGGTGIGLALCKKIVDNHQGAISVTSRPQEGTVFQLCLPSN